MENIRVQLSAEAESFLDLLQVDPEAAPEKMSKSRGNVITVDMAVSAVQSIDPALEFRDVFNCPIRDFRRLGIWRDRNGDGLFYCSGRVSGITAQMFPDGQFSLMPVLLCCKGEVIPPKLSVNGVEVRQHEGLEQLWSTLGDDSDKE